MREYTDECTEYKINVLSVIRLIRLPATNCVDLIGTDGAAVNACVRADGTSSKSAGTVSACNNFGEASPRCVSALVSATPQCPRYTCGGAANIGEKAFSLHNPAYAGAHLPTQMSGAGNGAHYLFAKDVRVTGLTIEQHGNGCEQVRGWVDGKALGAASAGTTPEGVMAQFAFPTPVTGKAFHWRCVRSSHSAAYAIYRAIPAFASNTFAPCCSLRCRPCGSGTACDGCDGSCNSAGPSYCDAKHPSWADGCNRSC